MHYCLYRVTKKTSTCEHEQKLSIAYLLIKIIETSTEIEQTSYQVLIPSRAIFSM